MFTGYLRDITERVRAEKALRESRARLLEVADEERKRIQRNLHDGAQQRITAVLLDLGRLRERPEERQELLKTVHRGAGREPGGDPGAGKRIAPGGAGRAGSRRHSAHWSPAAPIEVELATLPDERLPEPVEAAAYYVVAEALANVQKHAGAARDRRASTDEHQLMVEVLDDGVGGADDEGGGLRGLADRVEALGGRLSLDSPAGGGTRLLAEIPFS